MCVHHTSHHLQWICILLCVQAECWHPLWHELAVPRPSCEELPQLHFSYGSDLVSAVFRRTFVPAQTLASGYGCLLQHNFIITHYSVHTPILIFHSVFCIYQIPEGASKYCFSLLPDWKYLNQQNRPIYAQFECIIVELDREHKNIFQDNTYHSQQSLFKINKDGDRNKENVDSEKVKSKFHNRGVWFFLCFSQQSAHMQMIWGRFVMSVFPSLKCISHCLILLAPMQKVPYVCWSHEWISNSGISSLTRNSITAYC